MSQTNVKPNLSGKVCLVTGASRGIGKGIAMQLAKAGALVYITGRTLKQSDTMKGSLRQTFDEIEKAGGKCRAVQCDHSVDEQVHKLFETIQTEQGGRLDILINNAYSAVNVISKYNKVPYWEQPLEMWDDVNRVGLRNHYLCTVLATRMMVEQGEGLIVNISSIGGLRFLFNVPYGIGKAACDRMATDCSLETKKHGICVVSLWPGAVRTENITDLLFTDTPSDTTQNGNLQTIPDGKEKEDMKKIFEKGAETPEFAGIAIAHLAADLKRMSKTGKILLTTDLAAEYEFTDVDGSLPYSFRSVGTLLSHGGYKVGAYVPSWLKLPRWTLHLASNKF